MSIINNPVNTALVPCFLGILAGAVPNVTGNGANYQVAFDTIGFDNTGSFTTGGASHFTAPVAGAYFFSFNCFLIDGTGLTNPVITSSLIATSSTLSSQFSPVTTAPATQAFNMPVEGILHMAAGDTCYANINVTGYGSNGMTINGAGTNPSYTHMSGYLISLN